MSIKRDLTTKLEQYLFDDEILLIVGARQVGKTTLLRQLKDLLDSKKETSFFLHLEDAQYLALLNETPKNIFKIFPFDLNRKTFLFVDEVQYLKDPSNFLKHLYDEYQGKIKIIVSGSSAFYIDKKFKDSLAGRKKIFNLYGLSFREFLRFKGEENIFDPAAVSIVNKEKITAYYQEYLIYGGYPRVVLAALNDKEEILRDLAYSYIKKDVLEAHIRQDDIFYKLFKLLAAQTGGLVNANELASVLGVSKTSVDNYLYVMQKSFHIALVRPFYKNIRKELIKMPKVYFMDTGLRNFFKDSFDMYLQREDKGQLLENGVFRQLLDSNYIEDIKFWRTINDKEVDFVVKDKFAYEVKSQARHINQKTYLSFAQAYPEIKVQFVTLDLDNSSDSADLREIWEI